MTPRTAVALPVKLQSQSPAFHWKRKNIIKVVLLRSTLLCFLLLGLNPIGRTQGGPTPAAARLQGLGQRKVLEDKSTFNKTTFRSIGPSIMSGRVVDVEVNSADPTEFYVAYATGGLWHTTNNGQSFIPVFDSADVITIGDIAVNWKTRTIWVGTGEVNSSRSSYAGIGIYKSTDEGKTWKYLGLPESHHIGKILLHPEDDNIAWVAVLGHLYSPNKERGVYKTTDGGATWKQTLYVDDNTGVADLDLNPRHPDEVYAAAWYKTRSAWDFEESGRSSGIYKSSDGGLTWVLLTKQGSGFPTGAGVGRIGLAVYPANGQVVYAIVDNNGHRPDTVKKMKTDTTAYVLRDFEKITKEQFAVLNTARLDSFLRRNRLFNRYTAQQLLERVANGTLKPNALWEYLYDANTALFDTPIIGAEVYRSDDGGTNWHKTNTKELTLYNTYGYYFGKIFIAPANDQRIVITGFDIELSKDGGKTFTKIDKDNVHPDHHVAWINPARESHIFSGNDGGLNITYDDGAHWFKANTPSVGQYYGIAVDDARPYNVYGGLQDNGSWVGPSTNRETGTWADRGQYPFTSINGGDGMQVQIDTRDNVTTYTGFQFGNYIRINRLSAREGSRCITPQPELGERPLRFNWETPVLLSRHNADVLYFGSNRLYRSFNRGDSMVAISGDLTKGPKAGDIPFGTLTTIAESPLRFGLLYTGADDGNIQVSKDGGYTWTLISAPSSKKGTVVLPQEVWVSRVAASLFKEGRVYAALNGYRNDDFSPYLYVSENYGATWTAIGKDLPMESINVVKEDPKNENILYVGTDGGLYVSLDRGATFAAWNAGLPRSVPIHDIAIQVRENEIVLGTHGRSLYVAKLDAVQKAVVK